MTEPRSPNNVPFIIIFYYLCIFLGGGDVRPTKKAGILRCESYRFNGRSRSHETTCSRFRYPESRTLMKYRVKMLGGWLLLICVISSRISRRKFGWEYWPHPTLQTEKEWPESVWSGHGSRWIKTKRSLTGRALTPTTSTRLPDACLALPLPTVRSTFDVFTSCENSDNPDKLLQKMNGAGRRPLPTSETTGFHRQVVRPNDLMEIRFILRY